MKYTNLKPVKFKEANNVLTGFTLPKNKMHLSVSSEVEPLPAYFDGHQRITIWKCESILSRLRFLFYGEINLIELTENPKTCPKALAIGKAFL